MDTSWLAEVYSSLSQALESASSSDPPGWLSMPGHEWPMYPACKQIASTLDDPAWATAIEALTAVPAGQEEDQARIYETLFLKHGHKSIPLYESQAIDGRLLGPSTFAVKKVYEEAEMRYAGAELPDHASLELVFLAALCEQEASTQDEANAVLWQKARRLFLKQHASRWLPRVGQMLVESPFAAWKALGYLLIASTRAASLKQKAIPAHRLPAMQTPLKCNLCSFCVQVCPTKAITIQEDNNSTALRFKASDCIGCLKCIQVCQPKALGTSIDFASLTVHNSGHQIWFESQRAKCPHCGAPTVSQAELAAVIASIGHPTWLDLCIDCRINLR